MPCPTLDSVRGHDRPLERFRRTLQRGRLASTYLFVGPAGIGKRRFALGLARALLCVQRPERELASCGDCPSCQLLDADAHPDLLCIERPEGKTSLPIELFLGPPDRRRRAGLCYEIALRPLVGRRRVAVIDDADLLGLESANSLLKTLEEPPAGSVLILLSTSLARQLPTIRSRAQVVRFSALSQQDVEDLLIQPPHALPADEAQRLASQSQGSVARALAAADEALAGDRQQEVVACLAESTVDPQRLVGVLDEGGSAGGVTPAVRRERLRRSLGAVVGHYHERLRLRPEARRGTLAALEACLAAEAALERNANTPTVVQTLAQRLCRVAQ